MEQERNSLVSMSINDRVCVIEMQNPKRLNCLSEEMCYDIVRALDEGYRKECVAIVIKAQCSHGVCAIKRQFRILSKSSAVIPSESFERINAYRTRVYQGADYLEGIHAFLEKRNPQFTGKASDLDTTKY